MQIIQIWHFSQIHLHKFESPQYSLMQVARGIDIYVNAYKTEFMHFKQDAAISTLSLKLIDQFTYLSSCISSTESNVNICSGKTCTAIDKFSIIWKSNLTYKIKQEFIQPVLVLTTWTLSKCLVEKLDGNYARMLHAILKAAPHKTMAV